MEKLLDRLEAFYKKIGWHIERYTEGNFIYTTYAGERREWLFVAYADDETSMVTLRLQMRFEFADANPTAFSESLERLNELRMGTWAFDSQHGELVYLATTDFPPVEEQDAALRAFTSFCVTNADRHLPFLVAIAVGTIDVGDFLGLLGYEDDEDDEDEWDVGGYEDGEDEWDVGDDEDGEDGEDEWGVGDDEDDEEAGDVGDDEDGEDDEEAGDVGDDGDGEDDEEAGDAGDDGDGEDGEEAGDVGDDDMGEK